MDLKTRARTRHFELTFLLLVLALGGLFYALALLRPLVFAGVALGLAAGLQLVALWALLAEP